MEMTIRAAYRKACQMLKNVGFPADEANRDARELLSFTLHKDSLRVLLDFDMPLDCAEEASFMEAVCRRANHEPMAYIEGIQAFGGMDIHITPGVLIPRQDTLVLVDQALSRIPEGKPVRVLDLGCGSGVVIAALAMARPQIQGLAVDKDTLAIQTTRTNLERLGLSRRIRLLQSDWFAEINKDERFDVILSNPPYISTAEMQALDASVQKEPAAALWGGADGMDAYRAILPAAYHALDCDGWCLVEIGWKQGAVVKTIFADAGFSCVEVYTDEGGRDRVIEGCRMPCV